MRDRTPILCQFGETNQYMLLAITNALNVIQDTVPIKYRYKFAESEC